MVFIRLLLSYFYSCTSSMRSAWVFFWNLDWKNTIGHSCSDLRGKYFFWNWDAAIERSVLTLVVDVIVSVIPSAFFFRLFSRYFDRIFCRIQLNFVFVNSRDLRRRLYLSPLTTMSTRGVLDNVSSSSIAYGLNIPASIKY